MRFATCLVSYLRFSPVLSWVCGSASFICTQNCVLNPHIEAFNVSKTPWPDLSAVKWPLLMCITQKTRNKKKVFGLCPRRHFPLPESLALASIEPILKINKQNLIVLYVHVTVHRDKLRIKQPSRCIKYPKFILSRNCTCFGHLLCPSSGVITVHLAIGTWPLTRRVGV
jgi:hypothetical protein